MSEADKMACQRKCWQIAAVGGVVLWLVLSFVLGHPPFRALIISAVLALVGAYVLRWALCGGAEAEVSGYQSPMSPMSEPVRMPEPAPAASVMADVPPVEPTASENAPVTVTTMTPRPDPTLFAAAAPAAVVEAPAKPDPMPRAVKPKAPAKPRTATPKVAKPRAETARATGLDAAMGRSKEATSQETVLLTRPRGGKGDDLKLIVGVGPKLETLLNDIGVWHFDQIASWKARDIALVDSKMENFKGRITRDGWVKQARVLAKGAKPEGKA